MKQPGRTFLIIVAALLTFEGLTAMAAQPANTNTGPGLAAPETPDREALVREIFDLWGNAPNPVVGENRTQYGDLRAALRLATVEQLLDARLARTYGDVWTALPKRATNETRVIPLAIGQRIPQVIGDAADDLVFTPVVPCRIVDTRGGIAPFTGIIGPNSGNYFFVALTDYSPQGGVAGSCGIPTSPVPAAVAINLTSTAQTGPGNLRVINAGAGTPNVSLVNYVAGVNIANASEVRSTRNLGLGGDIFIYSAGSASQAVVDIMGYYNPPAATLPDNQIKMASQGFVGGSPFTLFSPPCDAGYRLAGGGMVSTQNDVTWGGSRPANGASPAIVSGNNVGDRWLCQGTASAAETIFCQAICIRIPGH